MTTPGYHLMPCPFCGAGAEVVHASHIRCTNLRNCDCETRLGPSAWNRRSINPHGVDMKRYGDSVVTAPAEPVVEPVAEPSVMYTGSYMDNYEPVKPATAAPNLGKWGKFVPIAQAVAGMSKDPSTKVGALALDEGRNIVATGYNGFPRGVEDATERYEDRPTKYKLISHAEQNLVAQAAYGGRSLRGCTVILSALYPCSACAKSLIQAGVVRVISPNPNTDPRWEEEAKWAELMFSEAGVEVLHY